MKKNKQEDIPQTIIEGSGVVYADLNSPKGTGDLLFLSPTCTVVGLNNVPYMLFATPGFNENDLPTNLKKDIYKVKEIVLQTSFLTDAHKRHYDTLPSWLANFQSIDSLTLEFIDLEGMDYLKDIPVQKLTFKNVVYGDESNAIEVIKRLKHLKEICYDHSFSSELIHLINTLGLKATFIE